MIKHIYRTLSSTQIYLAWEDFRETLDRIQKNCNPVWFDEDADVYYLRRLQIVYYPEEQEIALFPFRKQNVVAC